MPTMPGPAKPYGFAVVPGGAAATPLGPCGGIDPADALVAVLEVADPPVGFTDRTSEGSIPSADRVQLTTTDTTGAFLLVIWNENE